MTVFNLEKQGVFFDMEGGGRVQLRFIDIEDWRAIRKQTIKKKVEYKRIEGKAERFDVEEVNEDLQNELFWDQSIVSWENFVDGNGKEIPCTKENKILLMSKSVKFAQFIGDCIKQMADDEKFQAEQSEKN